MIVISPKLINLDSLKKKFRAPWHRHNDRQAEETNRYSIFYEDIKNFESVDDYKRACNNATLQMLNDEILNEIYINSGICSKKMHNYKIGLWFSFVATISLFIAGIIQLLA